MRDKDGKLIIDSKTKLYGLVGSPIEHSFSPLIHNFLFERYGLNKVYTAFNVKSNMTDAAHGIEGLGIEGFNVTSPYKEDIIENLYWMSERAKILGAVNTVKNINGRLFGFNTDFFGIVKTLKNNGVDLKGKSALVFGGGAVARTIVHVLEYMETKSMVVLNRTPEKARSLIENIKKRRNSFSCGELNTVSINNHVNNVDIVINATSIDILGMKGFSLNWDRVRKGTVFFDVIYNPQTTMIILADNAGFKYITGIDMLVWQALKSFQIWTGIWPLENEEMYSEIGSRIRRQMKRNF